MLKAVLSMFDGLKGARYQYPKKGTDARRLIGRWRTPGSQCGMTPESSLNSNTTRYGIVAGLIVSQASASSGLQERELLLYRRPSRNEGLNDDFRRLTDWRKSTLLQTFTKYLELAWITKQLWRPNRSHISRVRLPVWSRLKVTTNVFEQAEQSSFTVV